MRGVTWNSASAKFSPSPLNRGSGKTVRKDHDAGGSSCSAAVAVRWRLTKTIWKTRFGYAQSLSSEIPPKQ
jgi:hypothetical protein